MATAAVKNVCTICNRKASAKCEGCSQTFCYNHLNGHRQELNQQFDELEITRDLLRQAITEQTAQPQNHSLFQQIDKWEHDSINKIRQAADEARQLILTRTTGHVTQIETKLAKLTDQLRQSREEHDFVETDLNHWKDELTRLTNELDKPPNFAIRQDTTALVTKILVDVPSE